MRLLSIQELPQSGRVKLVFDDETVLKTQPYLLADFGLYSGMELSEEEYQALLAAAGKASARARAGTPPHTMWCRTAWTLPRVRASILLPAAKSP